MAKVVTDNKNYTDIASAIREKTGAETTYKPSEMASGVGEVYSKGHADGIQSEYDRFWDVYQNYGNRTNYHAGFFGDGWTDLTFKPKYNIVPTVARDLFNQSLITDLKGILESRGILLDLSNVENFQYTFYNCKLTKIPAVNMSNCTNASFAFAENRTIISIEKVIVSESMPSYNNSFLRSAGLRDITFEGVIANNISFAQSPLTVDSMKNVIAHLKNYAGTDKEAIYTVSFSSGCWANLEADSTSPTGTTWKEYVNNLGWQT